MPQFWSSRCLPNRHDRRAAVCATAVTLINASFQGTLDKITEAALNATERFALLLAVLKTMLESRTPTKRL